MRASITKRLDALETSLGKKAQEWAVIWKWGNNSEQVREEKLARWRAGENI